METSIKCVNGNDEPGNIPHGNDLTYPEWKQCIIRNCEIAKKVSQGK